MKDFKGFDDWIEIFKGGKQVDSMGRTHDGDAIIAKAVTSFNTAVHEPPLVVGHPVENAPAYGWVTDLAATIRDGAKVLLAKFKQVVPEFEDMAKRGLYKKRSASFYPDGRLRHVGFLGAAPPAVKGLADIGFNAGDEAMSFDFYDEGLNVISRVFRKIREYLIEKEGADKANEIIPDWDVEYIRELSARDQPEEQAVQVYRDGESIGSTSPIKKQPATGKEGTMGDFKGKLQGMLNFMGVDMSKVPDDALPDAPPEGAGATVFTEADIAAAKRQAAEEARKEERKKADAEFAEKERKRATEARQGEITTWYDQNLKEGKVLPAWAKMGLKEFMLGLDSESEIQFSETSKATRLEWFKNFMAELPKVVEFKEVAKRGDDIGAGSAGEKLSALVAKKRAADKDLDFTEAFKLVQIEHPDLALEYQAELHPNA